MCEGTGERAQVKGFDVAGKTGTGYKAQPDGTYFDAAGDRVYYSSFVGFFPAEDPQVTVLISIDEPPAGTDDRFGGTAAAPVFRELAPTIVHELGILPTVGHHRLRSGVTDERRRRRTRRPMPSGSATSSPASRRDGSAPSSVTRRRPSPVSRTTREPSRPGSSSRAWWATHHDGHAFAQAAVDAGAAALLVERELPVTVAQIVVDDTRAVLGHVAAAFHHEPSRALTTIGITGTNGKTTTAHLIAAALRSAGHDVGVIGTLSGVRTTPEATELQERLAGMRDEGIDSVVMEVSSHALALWRVAGTSFDAAVFTNLGRDHLDLHGSVEEYFRAKARLFTPELAAVGVTNIDDPYGRCSSTPRSIPMVPYSRSDASEIEVTTVGHRFVWRGRERHACRSAGRST